MLLRLLQEKQKRDDGEKGESNHPEDAIIGKYSRLAADYAINGGQCGFVGSDRIDTLTHGRLLQSGQSCLRCGIEGGYVADEGVLVELGVSSE
jgi:hypothetical protein